MVYQMQKTKDGTLHFNLEQRKKLRELAVYYMKNKDKMSIKQCNRILSYFLKIKRLDYMHRGLKSWLVLDVTDTTEDYSNSKEYKLNEIKSIKAQGETNCLANVVSYTWLISYAISVVICALIPIVFVILIIYAIFS